MQKCCLLGWGKAINFNGIPKVNAKIDVFHCVKLKSLLNIGLKPKGLIHFSGILIHIHTFASITISVDINFNS